MKTKSVRNEVKAIIKALSVPVVAYHLNARWVQARVLHEDADKVVIGRCVDSADGTEVVVDLKVTVHKPKV